jgi:SAM-dependent methyltransferase
MMITPGTQHNRDDGSLRAAGVDLTTWVNRWDAQQAQFMADREGRFQVLFDALEATIGDGPMTVLDLGCGPGSLAVRLLDRFQAAKVIAVDIDPVLLSLGRGAYAGRERLTFVTADLRDPRWREAVSPADAVVSSTALHWLRPDEIGRLYRDLADLIRPDGVFLDADHARSGPDETGLAEAASRVAQLHRARRQAGTPPAESWQEWWEAVRAEPAFAEAIAERDRLGHAHPHGRHELSDGDQRRLLREAGFQATDVLWRHGDDRILAARR